MTRAAANVEIFFIKNHHQSRLAEGQPKRSRAQTGHGAVVGGAVAPDPGIVLIIIIIIIVIVELSEERFGILEVID